MRRQFALAALAAVAAALTAWLPSASADAPVATAWWHVLRQQTPVGAIPAAPVPDDGSLPVQNGPAGVLAFSAVRYDVGTAASATLTLTLTEPAPTAPTVELCPTGATWTDGPDQEWELRPSYNCAVHAAGTVSGSTVKWQLTPGLLRDGELNAVLVPDPADPTPYSVSFARPTAASMTVAAPEPGLAPLPPVAPDPSAPAGGTAAAAGTGQAPLPDAGVAPVQSLPGSPVVAAPPGPTGVGAEPVASQRQPGSRTLAAALLAGAAAVLLLRGLSLSGPKALVGRSLLQRAAEAEPADAAVAD